MHKWFRGLAAGVVLGAVFGHHEVHAQTSVSRRLRTDLDRQAQEGRLRFMRRLRLGTDSGVGESFGTVWDVAIDSRGRVYVLDRSVSVVLVFGLDGRLLGEVGRQGDGPGEFRQPWRMAIGAGDTLIVLDVAHDRLSFFSPGLAYVRSVTMEQRLPPTDMAQLSNGEVILAAWDRSSLRTLHVFDRASGRKLRSFREVAARELAGFESSLLGGQLDITPGGLILYSQLTPYSLELLDPTTGRLLWQCADPMTRLSRPAEVVEVSGDRRRIWWNRFVHSGSVFAVSDSIFLNIVTDPINDRRQFDLVSRSCQLLSRRVLDVPMLLTKRDASRRLFVGALNVGVPEVVVYELQPPR